VEAMFTAKYPGGIWRYIVIIRFFCFRWKLGMKGRVQYLCVVYICFAADHEEGAEDKTGRTCTILLHGACMLCGSRRGGS
jgi:hypothetical protein